MIRLQDLSPAARKRALSLPSSPTPATTPHRTAHSGRKGLSMTCHRCGLHLDAWSEVRTRRHDAEVHGGVGDWRCVV